MYGRAGRWSLRLDDGGEWRLDLSPRARWRARGLAGQRVRISGVREGFDLLYVSQLQIVA